MIYLAPIQGFTDYIYRKAYSETFTGIDKFFIPYITLKNKEVLNKYKKEVLPENNPQEKVIPQVLAKDSKELLHLAKFLKVLGYHEINLNLGCPYPMVTNRTKGAGLLPHYNEIRIILSDFFEKEELKLSIKLRAGLDSPDELENVIPVLNEFPLTEVILHPRIAKQLYSGNIYTSAFQFAIDNLKHKLVYNGDIFSLSDYTENKEVFPKIDDWMLGRGILMDPLLPLEITEESFSADERITKLKEFHQLVYDEYLLKMDNTGNVLNKMKQFWSYFSYSFPNQKKTFKTIKKTKNLNEFGSSSQKAFYSLY